VTTHNYPNVKWLKLTIKQCYMFVLFTNGTPLSKTPVDAFFT